MLIELAQHVVADAKAREAEGDCPSPGRYSAEQVEAALVTVADALLAAEAKCDALREALALYRDAVRIDVQMDGPKFMGSNVSALKRAWEADRALTKETADV